MVVVGPAPAYAVSKHPDVTLTGATACKPQNQGDGNDYYVTACFKNNDIHSVTITPAATATLDGVNTAPVVDYTPDPFVLGPGASGCVVAHITYSSAGDQSVSLDFTVYDNGTYTSVVVNTFVPKKAIQPCNTGP